ITPHLRRHSRWPEATRRHRPFFLPASQVHRRGMIVSGTQTGEPQPARGERSGAMSDFDLYQRPPVAQAAASVAGLQPPVVHASTKPETIGAEFFPAIELENDVHQTSNMRRNPDCRCNGIAVADGPGKFKIVYVSDAQIKQMAA